MKNKRAISFFFLLFALFFFSCSHRKKELAAPTLVSVQFIDRNGFNETVSIQEKLKKYSEINFLDPQPYKKVVRLFEKNKQGKNLSYVSSYHDNGLIWQYLEVVNGRANGKYREWHPNGKIKIESVVVEGIGDLSEESISTWVFDEESLIYDEEGNLISKFFYEKGVLSKEALYFFKNGLIQKRTYFEKNLEEGIEQHFDDSGAVVGEVCYHSGIKEGSSNFNKCKMHPAYQENYKKGLLIEGQYLDFEGKLVSKIEHGSGFKHEYRDGVLFQIIEYKNGKVDGLIKHFSEEGELLTQYFMKDGEKHGEEVLFYSKAFLDKDVLRPKLSITWQQGKIHGKVKTWFSSGKLESEKEFHNNKKNGTSLAWYESGELMLLEEYEEDTLVCGTYRKKGEKIPVSLVEKGEGTATLYDSSGIFLMKIHYKKGIPVDQ